MYTTIANELCILFWQVYVLCAVCDVIRWGNGMKMILEPLEIVCLCVGAFACFFFSSFISMSKTYHFVSISFHFVHIYFICWTLIHTHTKHKCWTGCFKWALKMQAAISISSYCLMQKLHSLLNTLRYDKLLLVSCWVHSLPLCWIN